MGNSLNRHEQSSSTGCVFIKLPDLERLAKVALILVKLIQPNNSKHILIMFSINLNTVCNVKGNYAPGLLAEEVSIEPSEVVQEANIRADRRLRRCVKAKIF